MWGAAPSFCRRRQVPCQVLCSGGVGRAETKERKSGATVPVPVCSQGVLNAGRPLPWPHWHVALACHHTECVMEKGSP